MKGKAAVLFVMVLTCLALGEHQARAACSISVTGVAFGNYDTLAASPTDSTGNVSFVCQKPDKRIRITFSTGSSGSYAARTMRQGSDVLRYNLFINGLTTVWGDGTSGTSYYFNQNPPDNRLITLTIYGRMPAGQDVRTGTYSDTITVQIDF